MRKVKSLLKASAMSTGILYCVNTLIESNLKVEKNTKTGGRYFHWKHGDIYYKTYGEGKPLVLIHDLTVYSSGYEWSRIASQLASNHKVYLLDLIGCGKSDKPSVTYTNYFYVQMIQDYVREVIGEKADVIADGLSSSFVLMANAADKTLFDDIVVINPKSINSLKKTPEKHAKLLIDLFQLPVIGKALYYFAVSKANIDYYLTETCFYSPFKMNPAIVKAYYEAAHASNGSGKMLFASLLGNYVNIDISNALAKAENRILLITGSEIEDREKIEASYLKLNKNIINLSVSKSRYLPQIEELEQTLNLLDIL